MARRRQTEKSHYCARGNGVWNEQSRTAGKRVKITSSLEQLNIPAVQRSEHAGNPPLPSHAMMENSMHAPEVVQKASILVRLTVSTAFSPRFTHFPDHFYISERFIHFRR